jgi:hypothetical protein
VTQTLRALPNRARDAAVKALNKNVPMRAFAEFVVIVAGVLVALAANSWYTQRQDRTLERYYLEQLYADLRRDTAQVGVTRRLLAVKQDALTLLDRSFLRGETEIADFALVRAISKLRC